MTRRRRLWKDKCDRCGRMLLEDYDDFSISDDGNFERTCLKCSESLLDCTAVQPRNLVTCGLPPKTDYRKYAVEASRLLHHASANTSLRHIVEELAKGRPGASSGVIFEMVAM